MTIMAQVARIERAAAEMGSYQFEDCGWIYNEPAVRVTTAKGTKYLVFSDACTCPDDTERLRGTGALCKHRVAVKMASALQVPVIDTNPANA